MHDDEHALPTYTLSAAEGESTLDAEEYRPEKSRAPESSHSVPQTQTTDYPLDVKAYQPPPPANEESQAGPSHADNTPDAPPPVYQTLPPDYFTELTNNAAAAHTKRCSIIKERPATWVIKGKSMALCPLAATVLLKEGLLKSKNLELVSRSSGVKRDPTDPLSAVAFGVYDTVGDILLGLVQGPVELGKQVAPMMKQYEAKQHSDGQSQLQPSESQQSLPLRPATSHSTAVSTQEAAGSHQDVRGHYEPDKTQTLEVQHTGDEVSVTSSKGKGKSAMGAAGQVAKGTGKGLGKIVGAGFKAPMTFTHGLTRGFHNVPKLYGEEVREYENVVDIKSGLVVSAKGFGHGMTDGLKDFFVKPIEGAQKEGVIGFGKGFGKGIGNLVCKPAAGAIGIIGYSSVGVYKQIQGINFGKKDDAVDVVVKLGEAEFEQANEWVRKHIVRTWCEETMKQG
ncbi:hypothetical protein K458DRAFT_443071 [Lentithecium fluviatile CBS 122367]|uniref:Glycosyltransferase family 1 protein n=1 Tax=Lentithecium fluviatile CBS 122367 TaxID=1168545 RepID=A0A6G1J1J4_9PLEO|nr:hypothetical protein K458DRAFT_443071 [Lentithecium fluviatile CBS 122367]